MRVEVAIEGVEGRFSPWEQYHFATNQSTHAVELAYTATVADEAKDYSTVNCR